MLDITKKPSENKFNIVGILNQIKIKEGTSTKSGDNYISIDLEVRVDQEINNEATENIIPVSLFASRHKKGTQELNVNYDRIMTYKDSLVSLGMVDKGEENKASKVVIPAEIKENSFYGKNGMLVNSWRLSSNFINFQRPSDEEGATFTVTGVVGKKWRETDKEGNETGRLFVRLCVITYGGTANVIDFVAYGSKADFIDEHWQKGDTIKCAGYISMTHKVIEKKEETGFGDPIVTKHTVSSRELIIDRGCGEGLSDAYAYDADDIKVALDKRQAYLATLEENAKKGATKPAAKVDAEFNF